MLYERRFITLSSRDQLTGAVSGFLGYDGNGDSVALEKVGRDLRSHIIRKVYRCRLQTFLKWTIH